VKFREAYARGIPLIHYDRLSSGAEAYRVAAVNYLNGRGQLVVDSDSSRASDSAELDEEGSGLREAS
jgi:chromosome partitioning protein